MFFCDLEQSLKAVSQTVIDCLDEERNFMPCRFGNWEIAHDTGRWWEAALLLEQSVGLKIPERAERAMAINLRALTNNPFGMLMNDPEIFANQTRVNFHNPREELLALTALTKYRGSLWARRCGEKVIETVDRRFFLRNLTDDDIRRELGIGREPEGKGKTVSPYKGKDKTGSTGRAIEGLLEFWQATGSEKAKEVLWKAVEFHRAHNLHEDGSAPDWMECQEHVGHNHSYLGTLRGLLRVAIEFGDGEMKESIYKTYKNSVRRYCVSPSGFAPHDLARLSFPDDRGDPLGDHASCADAAYIAYLLAAKCGYTELFDDTERLIRARLFRMQKENGEDFGAWGIYGGYFGQGATIDVFCSTASTLCRIYNEMVHETDEAVCIDLHFSKDTPSVRIEARRGERQEIKAVMKVGKSLRVRLPAWCREESVRAVFEDGEACPFEKEGNYLVISRQAAGGGREINISFDLPERTTIETTWASGTQYRIFWRGDEILRHEEICAEKV